MHRKQLGVTQKGGQNLGLYNVKKQNLTQQM